MSVPQKNGLIDNIKKYVQTKIELAKEDLQDRILATVQRYLPLLGLVFTAGLATVFLLLGLAFYLNTILHSSFWGFWIIALVLMAMAGFLWIQFQTIIKKKQE